MLKSSLVIIVLVFVCLTSMAQDKIFTQQDASPLHLNPAMSGTNPSGRAMLSQRVQYPSSPTPISSTYFSYDQNFDNQKSSLGFWIMKDAFVSTQMRSLSVNLAYAHQVPLSNEWRLRLALGAGYVNKSIDTQKLIFGDQLNTDGSTGATAENIASPTLDFFDLSSGFVLHNRTLWLGFSAAHLNQPNQSFDYRDYRLPMRLAVQAGVRLPIGVTDESTIGLASSFRMQGKVNTIDLGIFANHRNLLAGLWYSSKGALALQAGVQIHSLRLTYAYEYDLGDLRTFGGAHEFSIGYIFHINTGQYVRRRGKRIRYQAFPLYPTYSTDQF